MTSPLAGILGLVMQARTGRGAGLPADPAPGGCGRWPEPAARAEEVQAASLFIAQTVHGDLCLLQQLGGGAGVRAEQGGADIGPPASRFVAELVAAVQAFLQTLLQDVPPAPWSFRYPGTDPETMMTKCAASSLATVSQERTQPSRRCAMCGARQDWLSPVLAVGPPPAPCLWSAGAAPARALDWIMAWDSLSAAGAG